MNSQVTLQLKNEEKVAFLLNRTTHGRNQIPAVRSNLNDISFRCADSLEEYIKAFRLVHDVYVQAGFIEPTPSGLRMTSHHGDPNSKVFLGVIQRDQQEVPVYTVSVFPDTEKNTLPMDKAFKNELDMLRSDGRKIVEVGALASNPCYRKKDMNIPMFGDKMVIRYAIDYLKADDLIIAIHPRHQWFYENIMFFEKIGQVSHYAYVKNNPAVAMRLDLKEMKEIFKLIYGNMPRESNLYRFLFKEASPCISYPVQTSITNPSLLSLLLLCSPLDKARVFEELNNFNEYLHLNPSCGESVMVNDGLQQALIQSYSFG